MKAAMGQMQTRNREKMKIVALGGPTSSGKTVTAKSLSRVLPRTKLIHLDDFYLPDKDIPVEETTQERNWDCAGAIDFDRFKECLKEVRNGNLETLHDSYQGEVDMTLSREQNHELENKVDKALGDQLIVIVDGFMLFHDEELCQFFDLKIFFHAQYETLKKRRESRKGYSTVEGFWVDPPHYFDQIVWPEYAKSHGKLFDAWDPNRELSCYALHNLRLHEIKSDNLGLYDMVRQTIEYLNENT